MLYRKSLRLSAASKGRLGVGAIVNLQSNDASKLWGLAQFLHILWSGPFQVSTAKALVHGSLARTHFAGLRQHTFCSCSIVTTETEGCHYKNRRVHKGASQMWSLTLSSHKQCSSSLQVITLKCIHGQGSFCFVCPSLLMVNEADQQSCL